MDDFNNIFYDNIINLFKYILIQFSFSIAFLDIVVKKVNFYNRYIYYFDQFKL